MTPQEYHHAVKNKIRPFMAVTAEYGKLASLCSKDWETQAEHMSAPFKHLQRKQNKPSDWQNTWFFFMSPQCGRWLCLAFWGKGCYHCQWASGSKWTDEWWGWGPMNWTGWNTEMEHVLWMGGHHFVLCAEVPTIALNLVSELNGNNRDWTEGDCDGRKCTLVA